MTRSSGGFGNLDLRRITKRSKFEPALLLALVLVSAGVGVGCRDDQGSSRPAADSATNEGATEESLNVILITIDTLRADALGAYGQERFTSPNLDQLAKEGVLFSQAMTSAPSTLPSHSSIMTGNVSKSF